VVELRRGPRFTDAARQVLAFALEEARLLNHGFIGTEHILLGLIHEGEGIAAQALEQLGISLESTRERVEETIGLSGTAPIGSPPFTPRTKKVMELSLREALRLGHDEIGTEHLLLGIAREGRGVAAQVLVSMGADLARVQQQVLSLLPGYEGMEPSEIDVWWRPMPEGRRVLDSCSFCGQPPTSGRLIASGGARICERCVAKFSRQQSEDDDERDSPKGE
jgi:ATP-dependent Clp protease ATP-binding subunit ClpC